MNLGGKRKVPVKAGKLRQSQLITTFGCGSIVSFPRESAVIASTDFWTHHDQPGYHLSEENLQSYLQVKHFVTPPGDDHESGKPGNAGLPAFRFPTWMYCPKCKRLAPFQMFNFTKHPRCQKCKINLVPSRFVIACENGHLDDFPYMWWVHRGDDCKGERPPELEISMRSDRSGLDSIFIVCRSCGAKRSMVAGIGGRGLQNFPCTCRRPWLNDMDPAGCNKEVRGLLRGATNLYFGVTLGALSIPPWSTKIQYELGKRWGFLEPLVTANNRTTFEGVIKAHRLNAECSCTAEEMWEQAQFKLNQRDQAGPKTWQEILEGEYRAFLQGSSDDDGEFRTKDTPVPRLLSGCVDRVVLAVRLREVMALLGFKRVNPQYDIDDRNTYNPVSRIHKDWLPAVELKGEGIFILFNEDKLVEWENRPSVAARYSSTRFADHYLSRKGSGFAPRYVLLHTVAHLLIRQMVLDCGYASASVKERIYCTFAAAESRLTMSGILLYTAATDSEGSLGGLVRQGYADRLDTTCCRMLETAAWCSEDPLCILSSGQGMEALNLAACHACTLLPETSCEKRNCYLDRAALIGTIEDRTVGFFSALLDKDDQNIM